MRPAAAESDRALPDPLARLDRPGGDPAALRRRCRDFRAAAGELANVGSAVAVRIGGVATNWRGEGADSFVHRSATLPRSYAHVVQVYRQAAGVVEVYAAALADAQHTFDRARALVTADNRRQEAVLRAHPDAVADLLSVDRIRARRMLEHSLERLHASGTRAGAVLRALEAEDGPRPPVLPEIYRGPASSGRQALDELHDKGAQALADLWFTLQILDPRHTRDTAGQMLRNALAERKRYYDNPIAYLGAEAYDTLNLDELEAGNDARWAAGLAFELTGHVLKRGLRLSEHHGGCHRTSERSPDGRPAAGSG